MIEITDEYMSLTLYGETTATARFTQHAVAGGDGALIVSTHRARLFCHNRALTALTLAERLAAGSSGDDSFVKSWRKELFL